MDELEEVWITVLPETRVIDVHRRTARCASVRTRVVQEFETADGEVEEISYNFFADCDPMNDVYYFGEEVFDGDGNPEARCLARGRRRRAPGHHHAGSRIPARFQLLPGTGAEREGSRRHTSMGFEIEVPAGVFRNCVEVTETSPLEPGEESIKIYCPNVGLVSDEELELIAVYDDAESPRSKTEQPRPTRGAVSIGLGTITSKGERPLRIQSSSRRSFQFHHLSRSACGSGVRAA